jgi:hypothetical protein
MKLESTKKKYTLYYDESNNVRKLLLSGSRFNIDRDPNQDSSPIFILAGIAFKGESKEFNFSLLKEKLRIQKPSDELRFSKMVKIRARYTPLEAFKYTLGSSNFETLFNYLINNEILIHYQMINTVYWSFIDIVDDLVMCTKSNDDIKKHSFYKSCLYRLIQLDKDNFLSLMSGFNFPNIQKTESLNFLNRLNDLIMKNIGSLLIKNKKENLDNFMLFQLGELVYKCINLFSQNLNFEMVFDIEKDVLIEDFSVFYINRINTFPNSVHVLDNESKVEETIIKICNSEPKYRDLNFSFVESVELENYRVQISDVLSGFIRLYFGFLEFASIEEVISFNNKLNPLQKRTLSLFKTLLDKSVDECHLLLHRVLSPIDEHKAKILFPE